MTGDRAVAERASAPDPAGPAYPPPVLLRVVVVVVVEFGALPAAGCSTVADELRSVCVPEPLTLPDTDAPPWAGVAVRSRSITVVELEDPLGWLGVVATFFSFSTVVVVLEVELAGGFGRSQPESARSAAATAAPNAILRFMLTS